MPDRRVIVFRSRLRPEHEADFSRRAEQVHARAITMPGFLRDGLIVATRVFHG